MMYSPELYRRRKVLGLCPKCGKKNTSGKFRCEECLQKQRNYQNKNRIIWSEMGLCSNCGKYAVPKGEKTCPECRAKKMKYKKPLTEREKEAMRVQHREKYKKLADQGICVRCNKRMAAPGKKKCEICLEKDAEKRRLSYVPKTNSKREYRLENHFCLWCGKPAQNGKKLCEEHQEQAVANGKKAAQVSYWVRDNKLLGRT